MPLSDEAEDRIRKQLAESMERVASAAVTDVLQRMIADCEAEADRSFQRNGMDTWAQEFYVRAGWIKRYLPAPTASEGAAE